MILAPHQEALNLGEPGGDRTLDPLIKSWVEARPHLSTGVFYRVLTRCANPYKLLISTSVYPLGSTLAVWISEIV